MNEQKKVLGFFIDDNGVLEEYTAKIERRTDAKSIDKTPLVYGGVIGIAIYMLTQIILYQFAKAKVRKGSIVK